MSEIEKLYENIGIGKKVMCEWTCKDSPDCNANCEHYESTQLYYPPFTAEKQLELIKWLIKYRWYIIGRYTDKFDLFDENFEQALAGILNNLWHDLTEEEKQQIRIILNGGE